MASIFLIGPMGSGKSTVGRALARRIGYRFIDADQELIRRCGVDIATIFDFEGETGFRDRETRLIDELTQLPATVLATGGGAVLCEANRKALMSRGHVILLAVDLDEQLRRLACDNSRPLLHTDDPAATLRALMEQRRPLYESVADYTVPTGTRRMHHVVARIQRHLRNQSLLDAPLSEPGTHSPGTPDGSDRPGKRPDQPKAG